MHNLKENYGKLFDLGVLHVIFRAYIIHLCTCHNALVITEKLRQHIFHKLDGVETADSVSVV